MLFQFGQYISNSMAKVLALLSSQINVSYMQAYKIYIWKNTSENIINIEERVTYMSSPNTIIIEETVTYMSSLCYAICKGIRSSSSIYKVNITNK